MKLEQVIRGKLLRPRRIVLYGTQGVGKSTFASRAPNPIFVPTEDGLNDIDCARFPLAKSLQDVMTAITEIYTQPHDFKTVVIDSADWLERLVHAAVCQKHNLDSIEDAGYGRGYVFALTPWRQVLEGLDALRTKRAMTVIVIAHARIERFEDPAGESFDRYVPRLHKLAAALLQEWCDEALFATWRTHTRSSDEGFGRKRTVGIGTGQRILRTTERPAHVAKNRLSLPEELPLEWAAFAKFLPDSSNNKEDMPKQTQS